MSLFPAAVLAIATACSGPSGPVSESAADSRAADVAMTPEQIAHAGVRWRAVEAATAMEVVEVPGQLAPNEDRTARLGAPTRARVLAVHVHVGDRVRRDQRLVTLVSEQAAAARAEHAKAIADMNAQRVAVRYARTALDRAQRLLELKAISRQEVDKAQVDHEAAEALLAQAQAETERASATLEQLGVSGPAGEMVVRAPLAGIVLTRDVVPGSVVDAGDALLMITDPATLWLEIAATGRVAAALRPGSRVTFTVSELAPRTFDATVENIGAALDPATRTLPLHAVVQDTAGLLRPAMFATVMLPLGEPRQGVAVPASAMQLLDERPVVFVARPGEDGGAQFERRDVEVGARTGEDVQILGGLRPGDVVVVDGAFAVKSEFARSKMPVD
jgi:cobalt-zinc-cadmium efflux system membrane fusion protein